jgi:hypothetical protein
VSGEVVGNGFYGANNVFYWNTTRRKGKLKPFSRRWRVGGSSLREERFMTVDGLG